MKFFSIKEYFYKLNTLGFIVLLIPTCVFIYLYYEITMWTPFIVSRDNENLFLLTLAFFFVVDLTIVNWLWKSKVKKLRSVAELAGKMDAYFSLTALRLFSYGAIGLLAAAGFYLTLRLECTALFGMVLLTTVLQWPGRRSFCRYFELKGSEREMILNNLDLKKEKRTRARS